jgi:hypothetical protein
MDHKCYLYLSITPEALIASMLPPEEFGVYYAVGSNKRTQGQAFFFEIDPDMQSDYFNMESIKTRCVPHIDGKPKRSVYLSTYRVLENIPLSAFRNLYLTTADGKVLELTKSEFIPESKPMLHFYQQLCPVTPRVVSKLNPIKFTEWVTDDTNPIYFPKLVFVELILNRLAEDPVTAPVGNLPYTNKDHLRDCLIGLHMGYEKPTKTVNRFYQGDVLYRTVKNGFFVGSKEGYLFYKFPETSELQKFYYPWWRSALNLEFAEK